MLVIYSVLILCQIQKIQSLFLSVGDYSNESIPGLNTLECGLRSVPTIRELSFNNDCYKQKYQNKSFLGFEIHKKPEERTEQPESRIYNGAEIRDITQAPWVVYIEPKYYGGVRSVPITSRCTGVLITPHWVLTAAHCFERIKHERGPRLRLSVGTSTKEGIQSTIITSNEFHRIHTNPLFINPSIPGLERPLTDIEKEDIRNQSDIALVRISFTPKTTPDRKYLINTICLPKRDEVNARPDIAYFYGYGKINDNKNDYFPWYLQFGAVLLYPFNDKECPPEQFCGPKSAKFPANTCQGDSGGPLVQFVTIGRESRALLVGTLRGGKATKCVTEEDLAYWVPAPKQIDWILKTIKEN